MIFNNSNHKKLSKQDDNKQDDNTDSKTFDVKSHFVFDDRVTVRCSSRVKEALKRFCLANGLSICDIFHALATAYLYGVNEKINFDVKSPTINVSLVHEVKRVRRYSHESYESVDADGNVKLLCHFCLLDHHSVEASEWLTYKPSGQRFPLCDMHYALMLDSGKWS
jgi:hypothetical protein